MRNDISVITIARQTLASRLAGLCAHLSAQPLADQKTPYELELARLLNACESEPLGVRRHVAILKRRAWWV